ncbi:D-alanyl-D-alanine carboxypeptidase DacC precursor [Roseovarius sp. THAF27]|uniref:D-alanyl-D-alanine carboxypeptidase/D-alanyl-D-alanine endopeptidase n=1 Tax=Roseovarius sp. THAF27 TaxID=2587850 RepID=UPI0012697FA9|nr:D-alanyl-D-alanine carboxypeptidase/D-alanyl-D-alanine-endopeptidase [Roseovarius sp. THAF27]QFT82051.1 D-alanyl-D-alanine carboxypeptidase DacC precursor [Roseovarius sp. THAF27]
MRRDISRRFLLTTALASLAGGALANAPKVSLRPQLRPEGGAEAARLRSVPSADALIERAKLGGDVGFSVVDVKTGKVLEGHAADIPLPPASVMKAITALYALETLGEDYRFETRLIATGPVTDGVLDGDVVLAGGGDPVLDTNGLADMAARLKKAGVTRVTGHVRAWAGELAFTRFIDDEQPLHVGYNPSLSGLNLNFNRVHFEWKRSGGDYTVEMDARSDRYRPSVRVARMRVAQRKGPVYTYEDGGDHDAWTVASGALGNGGSRWLPVRRPGEYAVEVFTALAQAQGVTVTAGEPVEAAPEGEVLVRHQSEPLVPILQDMLKYSNNLTAELVGLTATRARLGQSVDLAASGAEMTAWAQQSLGITGATLVDHSGLGETSRVTPEAMARALARVHGDGLLKPILKPFGMRDGQGAPMPDHPVKVAAKTGTLYFVSTLAGYATAPDDTELAFAIMTANQELREPIDSTSESRPPGAASWNGRSKRLQQALIERWSALYAG